MQGGKTRRRKKGLFCFFSFSKAHRELYLLGYFCLENLEAPKGSEEAEVLEEKREGKKKEKKREGEIECNGDGWGNVKGCRKGG